MNHFKEYMLAFLVACLAINAVAVPPADAKIKQQTVSQKIKTKLIAAKKKIAEYCTPANIVIGLVGTLIAVRIGIYARDNYRRKREEQRMAPFQRAEAEQRERERNNRNRNNNRNNGFPNDINEAEQIAAFNRYEEEQRVRNERMRRENRIRYDQRRVDQTQVQLKPRVQHPAPQAGDCIICAEERQAEEFKTLNCGHTFCNQCLNRELNVGLTERQINRIRCPNDKCHEQMEEYDVREIIGNNRALLDQYNQLTFDDWYAKQAGQKQCQTPDCGYKFLIEAPTGQLQQMVCPECRQTYCANCLFAHSDRIRCQEAQDNRKLGTDKNTDAANTQAWLDKTTRACPRCNVRIEKNDGCNHMTCRTKGKGGCGHEFCWLCLGNWRVPGGYHQCPPNNNRH